MAINETKIVIKAKDEASPVFVDMQGKLKGLGDAFKETSKHTSGLSEHIKEQRKEGRQHAFIMGEIKDALGVVGLAMNLLGDSTGKGNEEFKKINDSVNKGIVAFYGLDAVVSTLSKTFKFLGGGVGLAITAIGAIIIALADYKKNSTGVEEENKKNEESFNRFATEVENLSKNLKGAAEANKEFLIASLNMVEANLKALRDRNNELGKSFGGWSNHPVLKFLEKLNPILSEQRKEFESNNVEINKLEGRASVLSSTIAGLGATVTGKGVPSLKDLKKEAEENEKAFWKLTRQMNQLLSMGKDSGGFKLQKVDTSEALNSIEQFRLKQQNEFDLVAEQNKIFTDMNRATFSGFAEMLSTAFTGGNVGELLKKLALTLLNFTEVALMSSVAFESVKVSFTAWTGNLGAVLAALVGVQILKGIVSKAVFHSGGQAFVNAPADREVPIMVRGQETIRVTTPEQERRSGSGGVVINFNSPVSDVQFVKNSIKKVLRDTGLSVDEAFTNNRNKLSLA